jgi:predicted dehydrogenase
MLLSDTRNIAKLNNTSRAMKSYNRRSFLKTSLLASASATIWLPLARATSRSTAHRRVLGANGDIRYAVVGFNGRGKDHLKEMSEVKGTRLVALCDADRTVLGRELKQCENKGQNVRGYTDVRALLDDDDIDVVTFATPNHWHSLDAIWAMQAGKDVYVEKPISHEVWEGRQVVKAARKYKRIVQAGTQCRSSQGLAEAIEWVRQGNLGKIIRVRGLCYKRRPSIGKVNGPQPIPASVDYDLWCGPAPKEPLMRSKLHYDWHWVWSTGNGDLGNQGIHQMDIGRWILGEKELSPRVWSVGGRLGYVDDGTTPNTLIAFHDYKAAPLIFEVRGLPSEEGSKQMDKYHGADIGVVTDCEGGSMLIPNYSSATIFDKENKEVKRFEGSSSHFANFIDAVRSRNPETLKAEILQGHLSSALCHTANISYRLGAQQSPEQIREAIKTNPDLAESFGRMEQHLGANRVDLHQTPATLGAVLRMDPGTERFIGNRHANQLLSRHYRHPFVVPKNV